VTTFYIKYILVSCLTVKLKRLTNNKTLSNYSSSSSAFALTNWSSLLSLIMYVLSVTETVSNFNVPSHDTTRHFGDESFLAIDWLHW